MRTVRLSCSGGRRWPDSLSSVRLSPSTEAVRVLPRFATPGLAREGSHRASPASVRSLRLGMTPQPRSIQRSTVRTASFSSPGMSAEWPRTGQKSLLYWAIRSLTSNDHRSTLEAGTSRTSAKLRGMKPRPETVLTSDGAMRLDLADIRRGHVCRSMTGRFVPRSVGDDRSC